MKDKPILYGTSDVLPAWGDFIILLVAGELFEESLGLPSRLTYFTMFSMNEFGRLPPLRVEEETLRYWPFRIDPFVEIKAAVEIIQEKTRVQIGSFPALVIETEALGNQTIEEAAGRIREWREQKGGWIVGWAYEPDGSFPIRASSKDRRWPEFKRMTLGELFSNPCLKPGGTIIYYAFGAFCGRFTPVLPVAKEKPDVIGAFLAGIAVFFENSAKRLQEFLVHPSSSVFQDNDVCVVLTGELDLLTPSQWAAVYTKRGKEPPSSLHPFLPSLKEIPRIPGWLKISSEIFTQYLSSPFSYEARQRIKQRKYSALCFSPPNQGWWLES